MRTDRRAAPANRQITSFPLLSPPRIGIPDAMVMLAQSTEVFTDIFWMTIGAIFLAAIVTAVIQTRRKDRVLKLVHDHHVTLIMNDGRAIWGDLKVFSQGIELRFRERGLQPAGDRPSAGSYMIYQHELGAVIAVVRYLGGLTDEERREVRRQLRRRFNPGLIRRSLRIARNLFNTIKDAFSQALSAIVGALARTGSSTFVQSQQGKVDQIGQTLLTTVGHNYEPMLESHIGSPVLLDLTIPTRQPAGGPAALEMPGYLAEYSDKFVAMFNVDQPEGEPFEVALDAASEAEGIAVSVEPRPAVTNRAARPLVMEAVVDGTGRRIEIGAVLLEGVRGELPVRPDAGAKVVLRRLARVDIVCPRQSGVARHAASEPAGGRPEA